MTNFMVDAGFSGTSTLNATTGVPTFSGCAMNAVEAVGIEAFSSASVTGAGNRSAAYPSEEARSAPIAMKVRATQAARKRGPPRDGVVRVRTNGAKAAWLETLSSSWKSYCTNL